jgi:hypothetical protein
MSARAKVEALNAKTLGGPPNTSRFMPPTPHSTISQAAIQNALELQLQHLRLFFISDGACLEILPKAQLPHE